MKQLIQSMRGGAAVIEAPAPQPQRGQVLIRTAASAISVGTERFTASKTVVSKLLENPELLTKTLRKASDQGIVGTAQFLTDRLNVASALGYSSAGTVIGLGEGVTEFTIGDRVACAGAGYAVHAEIACVPKSLVVKIPPAVEYESAAFTTIGAIAMQGVRLAELRIGEVAAVIGLGLVGQIVCQILKASGCRVLGVDVDPRRAALAVELGADAATVHPEELKELVAAHSSGHGADAVLIAAATKDDSPVALAGELARDRGVVVAVGAVGLNIPRETYYKKELVLRISRSYGPGRYDPQYEEQGIDYPIGFVRWTENRNMQAFVDLLANGQVKVAALITHRFPLAEATGAYQLIKGTTKEPYLGVVIQYPERTTIERRVDLPSAPSESQRSASGQKVSIGLIGAGSFATGMLIPAIKRLADVELAGVCTASSMSARRAADKFGFRFCTCAEDEILGDSSINAVVITTRHHLHARQVLAALKAGKHVFCEKPLAINEGELEQISRQVYERPSDGPRNGDRALSNPLLMVGFNRRFAPTAQELKRFVSSVSEPMVMHYRVNAGYIATDHWTQDPAQGGGRIIGEVCHFVDFLTFIAGSLPVSVFAQTLDDQGRYREDNLVATIRFANGCLGTITYVANGDRSFPKERLELFGGGRVAVLDDFRSLELVQNGRQHTTRSRWRQDKGHAQEMLNFADAVRGTRPAAIAVEEILATTLATFRICDSVRSGRTEEVDLAGFIKSASSSSEPLSPDIRGS